MESEREAEVKEECSRGLGGVGWGGGSSLYPFKEWLNMLCIVVLTLFFLFFYLPLLDLFVHNCCTSSFRKSLKLGHKGPSTVSIKPSQSLGQPEK